MSIPRISFAIWILSMNAVSSTSATARAPLIGKWGGDRVNLVLDARGGRLNYDCGSGVIQSPLKPDRRGNFVVKGTHSADMSGPMMGDMVHSASPALYSGHVAGNILTLTVRRVGAASGDTYTLKQGHQVKLIRCL
jgi:hypothetical protein